MRPLALLLLLSLPALSEEPAKPDVKSPLPFVHSNHAEYFAKVKVTCQDCHGVGTKAESTSVPGRRTSCHGCHQQQLPASPKAAPRECLNCHVDLEQLKPDSHLGAWIEEHGVYARMPTSTCTDCHHPSTCVECHDGRGAVSRNPHDPGFRAVHGLEARLDPANCTICHEQSFCSSCHESGGIAP